jgi:hypothetical protein
MQFLIKIIVSVLIILLVSEIAKRHAFVGAIIASWPIISILTLIWLYVDTRNTQIICKLSTDLFWLTIPGIAFFLFLPALIRVGCSFAMATAGSLGLTAGFYVIFMLLKMKLLP